MYWRKDLYCMAENGRSQNMEETEVVGAERTWLQLWSKREPDKRKVLVEVVVLFCFGNATYAAVGKDAF